MLYTQPVHQTGYEHLPTEVLDAPIDKVRIWHDGRGREGDDWHITFVLQGSYGIGSDYIHINFDTHDFEHGLSIGTHISYGLTEGYCFERSEQKVFFEIPFEPGTPSLTVHKFNQVVQSHIPYIGLEKIVHDENFRPHHPSVLFITAFVQRLEAMRLIGDDTLSDFMSSESGWTATLTRLDRVMETRVTLQAKNRRDQAGT
ncbi:hypothetical protein BJ165DRAFT_1553233 [Panaeolus papilionaceus]|nr:hypothetical protein BJ165DRAFT_1553233 [Panaeolus papilionaceus]